MLPRLLHRIRAVAPGTAAVLSCVLLRAAPVDTEAVEVFDSAEAMRLHGWRLQNGDVAGMRFGWSPTAEAGGGPGELRGLFSRSSGFHYVADVDLGGTLTLRDAPHASGTFRMIRSVGFNGSIRLGYFDRNLDRSALWSFVGFEVQELSASSVRIGPMIQFADGSSQRGTTVVVGSDLPVSWELRWNPQSADRPAGSIGYRIGSAASAEMPVSGSQANQRAFWNAFGISTGFAVSPTTNAVDLALDDLRYSEVPPGRRPAAPGTPVRVFILTGASNARGDDDDITGLGDLSGPQRDILLFDKDRRLQPLVPPTALPRRAIGSDVSFARDRADHLGSGICVVKYAIGSTALGRHWQPGSEAGYYEELVSRVRAAMVLLGDAGYRPRISGLFLVQGEADSGNGDYDSIYAESLARFVGSLRRDLNAPEMSAVWSRIPSRIPPARYPFADVVRGAQVRSASLIGKSAWIDTDDLALVTNVSPPDLPNLHYTTAGEVELGHRFAAAWIRLNPDSFVPRVEVVGGRGLEVALPSMRGGRYGLETSPSPAGPFEPVPGIPAAGTGDAVRWPLDASRDAAFFRIRFDRP